MLSRPEQSVRCGLGIGFGGVPCQMVQGDRWVKVSKSGTSQKG